MTFDFERLNRLDTIGLDEPTRASLREARPLIEKHIDAAIDAAFARILRYPEAAKAYQDVDINEAKRLQRHHWLQDMLAVNFGDEQMANATTLYRKRHGQGLNFRWYFVFYTTLLCRLLELIAPSFRKPADYSRVTAALTKLFMFDLEFASAIYLDAGEEVAATTINRAADDFDKDVAQLVHGVAASAGKLETTARTMSSAAKQAAGQAASASSAAERASGNIQTVASATEELSSSINEISRQVAQSTDIAESAVAEAGRTNQMVQGLAVSASKIGEVVKLINDIASQTNLLALNATIEAARAGDAGKGFAVVANEVKSLANQTAKATDEISVQIGAVQDATKQTVGAIQGIGTTITRINEIAGAIAAAVEEQGAAAHEIARNVQEAARSGGTVSENITAVTRSAGEAERAADGLLGDSRDLAREAERLKSEVAAFLGHVRKTR
jgi:methyl-accepting chemotaxis protein